ncbi:hypothetical protein [Viridibacillus arvi]|uniref:hypothetical protein n=1 Tax=Viridibacillus arvi TaxID=263475 RepID=UPI0034CD9DFB
MENILWVTRHIPKQAVILLVDMQEHYFQDAEVSEKVQIRIQKRLSQMKAKLLGLKERGHTIYAVVDEAGIHPTLEGIPDTYLPAWCNGLVNVDSLDPAVRYLLHPQILEELSTASADIVVCGLWRELCLYTVTRLLQKEEIIAYLSIDPDISFENAMMWEDNDNISLESECEEYGVLIQAVEQK